MSNSEEDVSFKSTSMQIWIINFISKLFEFKCATFYLIYSTKNNEISEDKNRCGIEASIWYS